MTAPIAGGSPASVLDAIRPLVAAGLAVHHLYPRSKKPVGEGWPTAPVATLADLTATYRTGYNVGVRLGEPSRVAGGFVHVFDVDIHAPEQADEAWEALRSLLPDVDFDTMPSVISGSGGASRHLYFLSDKPFRSKLVRVSDEKYRETDGRWRNTWEIELFGMGKQIAAPPSIHPDTGKPYLWERPLDLDGADFGLAIAPIISADVLAGLTDAVVDAYDYETVEPYEFKPGQLEADLDALPMSDLHYDDWLRVGQALHHQFGGSDEGFDLWLQHTRRSSKFGKKQTPEQQIRQMRRVKWRSFGRYRGRPVTMGTLRMWAKDARLHSWFDDEDDFDADSSDLLDVVGTTDDDLLGGPAAPVADDIDAIGTAGNEIRTRDWMSLADLTDKGGFKATLHNIELIVKNDPRLIGLPQRNEFTQETVQRITPGLKANRRASQPKDTRQLAGPVWTVKDTTNGDLWSAARDYAIRSIIEAPRTQGGYELKVSDRDLKAAMVLAAWESQFHPVREYLTSLTWDGVARIEMLWVRYVHAPNDAYHREVARLMLVAAVARIFEPGAKFDFCTVLEGLQGKRKSTLISVLGRHRWFGDPDFDFTDAKKMVENMQGVWICEAPELTGFKAAEVKRIKSFISRQTDRVRLAYEARAAEYPRQSIIIATTNDDSYLFDRSGGRRFWPVETRLADGEQIDTEHLESQMDQMWAEAVRVYRDMRAAQPRGTLPLYLTDPEAVASAEELQESRRVETGEDAMIGKIEDWLDRPMSDGGFDDEGEGKHRVVTCLSQIATECLGISPTEYQRTKFSYPLGRAMKKVRGWHGPGKQVSFKGYERQRSYWRDGHFAEQVPSQIEIAK